MVVPIHLVCCRVVYVHRRRWIDESWGFYAACCSVLEREQDSSLLEVFRRCVQSQFIQEKFRICSILCNSGVAVAQGCAAMQEVSSP